MKVAIVGAGVAGSVLGHILAGEPGIELTLLEQAANADQADSGTGLNICPNGLKALAAAAPGLHDQVRAASLPWLRWQTFLADGTPLMDLALAKVADAPGIRIRWSALYALLRRSAERHIRYGATVQAMRHAADGRLSVAAGNTALDGIDLLIGADGRYSRVRTTFLTAPVPRQAGICVFRLIVPDTSGGLVDDYGQWFNGPNRLLAFRVPDGAIYIAGACPIAPNEDVSDGLKTASALDALYRPAAILPCPAVAWMLRQITGNLGAIHWARAQEIDIAFRDAQGRVLLLGDAAHAMVPTLGQGATTALEDACLAGVAIRDAVRAARAAGTAVDVPVLVARIEAVRAPRVRFIMDLSVDASDTMRPGADPVAGTRRKLTPAYLAQLRRLYGDVPALAPS